MNITSRFEPGTYVTNGNMSGIVSDYTDDYVNGRFINFYIVFNNKDKNKIYQEMYFVNDGSFRKLNDSEINEFNQRLLKNGYIWNADSMQVVEVKETASTDNKESKDMVKKESKPKFKTGDFLTSIDEQETFIFMKYDEDGWLLGWNVVYSVGNCCDKCEVQRFNPSHPWHYSDDCDKEKFLCKLKDTCHVWYDDVKEMRKEYELDDDKLKCGDIIKLRDGEIVIFDEITSDKLKMRVWHAPADGNILVDYNRFIPWKYATGDEQDFILDIMAGNGYVWDKDENHFFSNPRMISTNVNSIVVEKPNEIEPINIPDGYRANIENGKIYFIKEFKDGDFIKTKIGSVIGIFKELSEDGSILGYAKYYTHLKHFIIEEDLIGYNINEWEHATAEDIKLFKEKLAEQNYKWDEESKKLVNSYWAPKVDETYYFINRYFKVVKTRNINSKGQRKYISLHNCFKTEEEAMELLNEMKQMFVNYNKQKYGK